MKTIPLMDSSEVALVDDARYPELSKYEWFLYCRADGYQAIVRSADTGGGLTFLYRVVMGEPEQPIIYRDGNYRNCQRGNLRIGPTPGPPQPPKRPQPRRPSANPCKHPRNPKPPRGPGPPRGPKPHVTVDDHIEAIKVERFREWLYYCKRNWAEGSVIQYAQVIRQFVTFLAERDGRPVEPTCLTVSDVEQYLDHLLRDCGRNTGNSHLTAIKSFFTWQAKRYRADNIGAEVPLLCPEPPEQRVLTDDEYHAVLNVAEPSEKDIIQFLAHTGLRRGEFIRLQWSQIAQDLSLIRFLGKGRKERVVPLSAIARDILKKYENRDAPIPLVVRYGNPWAMNYLCNRLAERAGIPPFGPHAIRHYFCTRMVKANVSIKKVSKVLGHSSLAITEHIYCHLLPEDLIGLTDVLTD
jgi:integrase/recombinase XerD